MTQISGEAFRELLKTSPRKLANVEAELLFIAGGSYLFHYQDENGSDRYKFLSPEALRSAFCHEPIDSGWLPEGVVRWGNGTKDEWVVKWVPPKNYELAHVQLGTVSCALPGMVFLGMGVKYWLWAIAGKTFTPDAPLFSAPLSNIHASGEICWGNMCPPLASPGTINEAWELFIMSDFNDDLSQGKAKKAKNIWDILTTQRELTTRQLVKLNYVSIEEKIKGIVS